jgi:hypothetical protein
MDRFQELCALKDTQFRETSMFASFRTHSSRRRPIARSRPRLLLEELEARTVPSLTPLSTLAPAGEPSASLTPDARGSGSTTVTGPYQPSQIRTAYGFDQISFLTSGGKPSSIVYNSTAGSGQTIALVDAYYDSKIVSDLTTFDTKFGLPGNNTDGGVKFLTTVGIDSQTGNQVDPSTLTTDAGWAGEISLDVEWAHAMAPAANILLVESSAGNQVSDMIKAVNYAAAHSNIVSMSWGSPESALGSSTELADDANFQQTGVTFIASSGDSGTPAYYPSASPDVVSVGGTHLVLNSNSSINSESAWGNGSWSWLFGGSGGGYSSYETEPGFQSSYAASSYVQTTLNNKVLLNSTRGTPDVAYNADPNDGFYIYDSVPYQGSSGWLEAGGTSAGAPQWAALIAIADQARAAQAVPPGPLSSTGVLSALYTAGSSSSTYGTNFRDITKGSNGDSAVSGYDLVTGLGSPKANALLTTLQNAVNPMAQASSVSAPSGSGGGGNTAHIIVQPVDTSSSVLSTVASSSNQAPAAMPHTMLVQVAVMPSAPLASLILPSSPSSAATVIPATTTPATTSGGTATFSAFTGILSSSPSLDSTRSAGGASSSSGLDDLTDSPTEDVPLPDPGSDVIDTMPIAPAGVRIDGAAAAGWTGPRDAGVINDATITTLIGADRAATPVPADESSTDHNSSVTLMGLFAALGTSRLDRTEEKDADGRRKLLPPPQQQP